MIRIFVIIAIIVTILLGIVFVYRTREKFTAGSMTKKSFIADDYVKLLNNARLTQILYNYTVGYDMGEHYGREDEGKITLIWSMYLYVIYKQLGKDTIRKNYKPLKEDFSTVENDVLVLLSLFELTKSDVDKYSQRLELMRQVLYDPLQTKNEIIEIEAS